MESDLGLLHVWAFAAIRIILNMKTMVFLDVNHYSLAYKCRRFRGTCYVRPHGRRTCSGRRAFFSHNDAAEYYSKIRYLSTKLPGDIYRKRVILIITTARTSNVTRMDMNFVTGHFPFTQHSGKFLIITEQKTMGRPRQEWEDNTRVEYKVVATLL
jgi:hypothetical protein